jgi:hypothetical protein
MKKLLFSALLLPAMGLTQPIIADKEVVCEKTEIIIGNLQRGQYKESPVWVGRGDNDQYALFTNEQTKTWTIIQFNDSVACIIGAGEDGRQITKNPRV